MESKVALVTGASRGIGKASALALARAGYDLVITARTVEEGAGRLTTPFKHDQRQVSVPGSLESTAAEVESLGRRCLSVKMDILDRASLDTVVAQAMDTFGRIDVLMNNAIYQGPGLMYLLEDIELDDLEKIMQGNLYNQLYLTQKVVPIMLEQGGGVMLNMTSGSAQMAPPAPADKGGWGFAYAASKSAFHRLAEFINVEYRGRNIRAYNIDPGYTVTEATRAMFGDNKAIDERFRANTPEDTGEVVGWLAHSDEEGEYTNATVYSPTFFAKYGIEPAF